MDKSYITIDVLRQAISAAEIELGKLRDMELEWSCELLTERQKQLLTRMFYQGCFYGGLNTMNLRNYDPLILEQLDYYIFEVRSRGGNYRLNQKGKILAVYLLNKA